jgi:hypothetical protein
MTWDLLDSLKKNPIPMGDKVLDYSFLKKYIHGAMYGPSKWNALAFILYELFISNATMIDAYGYTLNDDSSTGLSSISLTTAFAAIHCSDRKPRVASFDEFHPTLDALYNISSVMGDNDDTASMLCARWKIEPKERYEGSFTVQTKNPVLFIGNTWDGHTPLLSAYNVSSGFNGSAVLEVHGYGVSAFQSSRCYLYP